MFNRQPFNRGKYNLSGGEANSFFGEMTVALGMRSNLSVIKSYAGCFKVLITEDGSLVRTQSLKGTTEITIGTKINLLVRDRKFIGVSNIFIGTENNGFNSYGYEYIKLPGLVLKPGDELILDTGEMTVSCNGENISHYFSQDSEFFNIKHGENIVVYENGTVNSKSEVKILWKDAYL